MEERNTIVKYIVEPVNDFSSQWDAECGSKLACEEVSISLTDAY